jgi:hypothetical protein
MQHVDGIIELRHIQHPERSCGISKPNFPHPSADRIHRFPVVRLAPMLDLVELITASRRAASGNARKSSSALPRNSTGLDFIITVEYTKFCIDWQLLSTVAPS